MQHAGVKRPETLGAIVRGVCVCRSGDSPAFSCCHVAALSSVSQALAFSSCLCSFLQRPLLAVQIQK